MSTILLLALLAAPAVPPRPVPAPPPDRIFLTNCPTATGDEIIVCGDNGNPRLPLPDERERPAVPRQPTGDPRAGLENAGAGGCASLQGGCASSVNIGAMAVGAARAVGKALRKKPDTSNRVPIDLDAPPPPIEGRLSR